MKRLEELKLNETKEIEARIYGPGLVIIEGMLFNCVGSEDLEIEDKPNEFDVYYVSELNIEDKEMIFKLVENIQLGDDYFDPIHSSC